MPSEHGNKLLMSQFIYDVLVPVRYLSTYVFSYKLKGVACSCVWCVFTFFHHIAVCCEILLGSVTSV